MPGLPTKPNNIPLASSLPKVSFRRIPAEEALALAAPAGVLDQQNVDFGFNDGRPFERPEHYLRYVEPIEGDLKNKVEYDMDEQDQEWLDLLNADRKREQLDAVSNEVFEIILDQLEKEWFDLMKQVPAKPPHGGADGGDEDDDDGDDTKCAICDDGEGENSNAIVFCDGCNLAVHQDCYGIPYVPEGQWLCRKCTVSPDRAVSCLLCPHEGGAFKQTTTGKWAHLLCAMWIPETGVSNPVYMEPIDSVEKIPKARWKLQCYLCRCKMGACIQCDSKVCYAAFHVTCAMKAGLLIQTERKRASHHGGDSDDDSDGDTTPVLRARCHKHVPPKLRSQLKISFDKAGSVLAEEELDAASRGSPFVPSRTREHSMESGSAKAPGAPLIPVSRSGSVLADPNGTNSKSARAYKKSYRAGPPLVPAYIINRVLEYVGKISLRKKPPLVAQIARFWSLKREARRGAPLLKRLHLEPWTASSHTKEQTDAQKAKKLAFIDTLRKDLEHVRMLAELVRKREKEKLRQAKALQEAINSALFPYYDVLRAALDKIEQLDRAHFFAAPVSRTDVPDYYDVIKEPMDWATIREKLHEKAYVSIQGFKDDVERVVVNATTYNKPDTQFHKAALRIQRLLPGIYKDLDAIEGVHLASFGAQVKQRRASQGAESAPELEDDIKAVLQQLLLEPPIGHVELLRDYDEMDAREVVDVRGPDDKLAQFFLGMLEATAHGEAATPSESSPAHVANVMDDLARQFYRPRLPAHLKKALTRPSHAGPTTPPNTRSRRQSSEISNDSVTVGDRRVRKRIKSDADAPAEVKTEDPEPAPRPRRRSSRQGTPTPAAPAVETIAAPSVPPIAEDAEPETQEGAEGDDGMLPHAQLEEHEESATAAPAPKATRARASGRGASTVEPSSRSTRSRPATNGKEDGAVEEPDTDAAREADAGSDAATAEGSKPPKRQRRGQIPGEPDEIETEEVDAHDSFLRFNKGWILKDGAKRSRAPRVLTNFITSSASSAASAHVAPAEESPAKRPRKASAPSTNTTRSDGDEAAIQQRPRSKTHPIRSKGNAGDVTPAEAETPANDGTPGRGGRGRKRKAEEDTGAAEDAADAARESSATPRRGSNGRNYQTYGARSRRSGNEDRSSPLTSEGEDAAAVADGGEGGETPSKPMRNGRTRRRKADVDADGAEAGTQDDGEAATVSAAAEETLDEDEEGSSGVPARRAYESRRAKVKVPPAGGGSPRKSQRGKATKRTTEDASHQGEEGEGEDQEDEDEDEDPLCAPHTLVWAKMDGFPHFPAEVVDESDSERDIPARVLEGKTRPASLLGARSSSSAPSSTTSAAGGGGAGGGGGGGTAMHRHPSSSSSTSTISTTSSSHTTEDGQQGQQQQQQQQQRRRPVLIQFFGGRVRDYVWLPKSKLRMMFEDEALDQELLAVREKKYAKHRKKVRDAYELARAQLEE